MIARLKLTLSQEEYTALYKSALADLRSPSDQARFILRQELEKLGWLSSVRLSEIWPGDSGPIEPHTDQALGARQ